MKPNSWWVVCLLAGAFGYLGGRLGAAESRPAVSDSPGQSVAMTPVQFRTGQQNNNNIQTEVPQRFKEIIVQGNSLVFRAENGRPLMVLADTAQGTTLFLANGAGKPSIGMVAGSQGNILLSTAEQGGQVKVGSDDGNTYSEMTGNAAGPEVNLVMRGQSRMKLGADGEGGMLTGSNTVGKKMFEMKVDKAAGVMSLFQPSGKLYFDASCSATDGGLLSLFSTGSDKLELHSDKVQVHTKGEVSAQFPAGGGQ